MSERLEELMKQFGGVRIRFGLEAQGHIPTVERMLAEGKNWDEIGDVIGWCGPTAKEYYERYQVRLRERSAPQKEGPK